MIVNSADVQTGFKQLWDLSGLPSLVPGGLHHGRVPEVVSGIVVASPYASLVVEEAEYILPSGRQYLQAFNVQVWIWSTEGAIDAGQIRQIIDDVFDRDRVCPVEVTGGQGALTIPGAVVIDMEPLPSAIDEDPATKEAKDVLLTKRAWKLWIQADRQ